ncbi:hypothetical protein BCR35DRAFT_332151 [Leucosporidium creatinivorum]|uniref:Uncharacterized protein n=1 Tax=Leucosporidium creatinivorum TaxID=106004 RepID=A0A1Y2F682_9BASI|nr:hypothetical protein BCR35DRAFT_332151 [Leucosporidium creatinivorum]
MSSYPNFFTFLDPHHHQRFHHLLTFTNAPTALPPPRPEPPDFKTFTLLPPPSFTTAPPLITTFSSNPDSPFPSPPSPPPLLVISLLGSPIPDSAFTRYEILLGFPSLSSSPAAAAHATIRATRAITIEEIELAWIHLCQHPTSQARSPSTIAACVHTRSSTFA